MIPILGNEFRVILGRLGAWPCDFSQEVAAALYDTAIKHLVKGGTALDMTPSGGKTTVILSAAAFRNGATSVALVDNRVMLPMEVVWFNRAYKTFKLQGTCIAAERVESVNTDIIVVRGDNDLAMTYFAQGLKPNGILFQIGGSAQYGTAAETAGNGWAVWRKAPISMADIARAQSPSVDAEIYKRSLAKDIIISEEEARVMKEAQEA